MRAIRCASYGGPEVLRFAETDAPVAVGSELLVRVKAASLRYLGTQHASGKVVITV